MDLGIDFEKQYQLDIYLKMIKWNTTFSEKKKITSASTTTRMPWRQSNQSSLPTPPVT